MEKLKHIVGSIARTLLALTFLFSGIVKAVDPLGTTYKIEDYLKAFGGWFTDLLPLAGAAAITDILIVLTTVPAIAIVVATFVDNLIVFFIIILTSSF